MRKRIELERECARPIGCCLIRGRCCRYDCGRKYVVLGDGDFASVALRFYSLSGTTGSVLDRCHNPLGQKKELMQGAVTVLDEYDCSVLQATPILTVVYEWRQNILNDAWRKRDARANAI